MKGRLGSIAAVVVCLGLASSHATATTLLDFTFEGDPVGSVPAGWTLGTYDGQPTTAHVTDITAGSGSRSFYLNDYASAAQLSARSSFPTQSTGLLRQTGKARVEQNGVSLAPFTLLAYGNARCNNIYFDDDGTFAYEDGHGNFVSTGVSYTVGEWYSFEYLIDLDAHRWRFSIEDSGGSPVASASDLQFGTSLYFDVFEVRSWGVGFSGTGQWYIDDVRLDLNPDIPEPLTALGMLAGIAGLGAYVRRKRRT